MRISIGVELETNQVSFCLVNPAHTVYNPATSKPKTLLEKDDRRVLAVSADFVDALYATPVQAKGRFLSAVVPFLDEHPFFPDRYKLHLADGKEYLLKNTSSTYTFKSVFRNAEFDYLFLHETELRHVSELTSFLFSRLRTVFLETLAYMKDRYSCVSIQNADFPYYRYAFLPSPPSQSPPHLFLSEHSQEALQDVHFSPQITLGIPLSSAMLVFHHLFRLYSAMTSSEFFPTFINHVMKQSRSVFLRVLREADEQSDKDLLQNYIFLFFYSYLSHKDRLVSRSRKYGSLLLLRHRFSDLVPKSVQQLVLRHLDAGPGDYFRSIHQQGLTPQEAVQRQDNQHIHLYPVQEGPRILVEFRGLDKMLRKESGGATARDYLETLRALGAMTAAAPRN
jgi:hypothetical protein